MQFKAFILLLVAAFVVGPVAAAASSSQNTGWTTYGFTYSNMRYVPFRQIDASNVNSLKPAWHVHTGISGSFEDSPTVVGTTMYVATGVNDTIIAMDARTGKELWRHKTSLQASPKPICCGTNNRGVAVDGSKLFYATLDGRLIALDTATGKQLWATQIGKPNDGFSETMAPLVFDHKVYIGSSGGEYGIRGSFTAYSESGKQIWRWYVVGPGWEGKYVNSVHGVSLHRDIAKEKASASKWKDAWKHGGGPIWQTPAVDTKTHTIFLATGNPSPQLISSVRPGDNLYTDSIVALDANTGKMKWYYQETPHDIWDYDATSPTVLFNAQDGNGNAVPAVGEASKTGWFYVLDRRNGHFIRVSQPFVPQKHIYEPPAPQGSYMEPGALGGSNWPPVAYNPGLGYAYVTGVVQPRFDKPKPYVKWKTGGERWAGSREVPHVKSKGTFTAIDVNTGQIAWQHHSNIGLLDGALATPELTFVGVNDTQFVAYDAKSGNELWKYKTDAGVSGPPVAYMIDGREYIAVVAGGDALAGNTIGDSIYVFALPKSSR